MENDPQAFNAKLAKEYEVPMVSMDGEAHPEITLAAVGLGIVVACIILITLIALISRRKRHFSQNIGNQRNATEIFTITKPVDDAHSCRSCRSSTVTISSDIVTEI
uniref:Protein with signal anchor n=1 Tax=Aedes albopictus TaxID=7160 RepID=A0A1W7R830_AEDAL